METNDLLDAWKAAEFEPVKVKVINPVLQRMRRQLLIEAVAFIVFLVVYYDFFDGDRKPLFANVLLAGAMILTIGYNLVGYGFAKRVIDGGSVRAALEGQLRKLKLYAYVSVLGRALMISCVVGFFCTVIVFNPVKYWMLVGVGGICVLLLYMMGVMWRSRIRRMEAVLAGMK
jgi:hypothetical protein